MAPVKIAVAQVREGGTPPPPRRPCESFRESGDRSRSSLALEQLSFPPPDTLPPPQLRSTLSKPSNLATISRLASEASASGAVFLFLPEVCTFMSLGALMTVENAEEVPKVCPSSSSSSSPPPSSSSSLASLSLIASTNSLWISGTLHESSPSTPGTPGKVYNTHIILDDTGALRATYRKIHLFDVDIPTACPPVKLFESNTTLPGDAVTVLHNTPLGTLGIMTCYDLRFSYLSDVLRNDLSASTLLYPSAFTVPTGRQIWEPLLRARAAETQCHVIAAAQCGVHSEKRRSYGHSMVVGPWGEVLAEGGGWDGDEEEPGKDLCDVNVYATVDAKDVEAARRSVPVEKHRRVGRRELRGEGGEEGGLRLKEFY